MISGEVSGMGLAPLTHWKYLIRPAAFGVTCAVVKAPWVGLAICVDMETGCSGAHLGSVQNVGVPITLHSLGAIRGLKRYSEGHNLDGRGLAGDASLGREGPCRGRLAEGAGVANHHVKVTG